MNFDLIFEKHELPKITNVIKIEVGFSNTVYSIDDKYILKVCTDIDNQKAFEREASLYAYFENILPVPKLIAYDKSKTLIEYDYLLYHKIPGDNLYNVWHKLSVEKRKILVEELCGYLKIINSTNTDDIPNLKLQRVNNWADYITINIFKSLDNLKNSKTIDDNFYNSVREYVNNNRASLDQEKIGLVYWDVHFDNVLVKDGQIVGLIDFERTELASIDFVLDTVKRMVDYPKKYMSLEAEQFADAKDYTDLLEWYKHYYPQLFNFENLETRLNLYTIEHNLKDLLNWPNEKQLTNDINIIISK